MVKCGNFHNPPVATWFVASVSLNALSMIPTKHAESDFGVRQDLLRRMIQALSLCRLFPTEHAGWGPSLVEAVGDLSDLLPTLPAKITIPYSSLASSELGKCTLVDEDVDVGTLFQSLEADWSYWVKSRSSDDIDTLSRALVALRRIVNCVNRDEAFIPVEEVVDGLQSCTILSIWGLAITDERSPDCRGIRPASCCISWRIPTNGPRGQSEIPRGAGSCKGSSRGRTSVFPPHTCCVLRAFR